MSLLGFLFFFSKVFFFYNSPKIFISVSKKEKSFNIVVCYLKLYFDAEEMTQLLVR